MGELYQDLFTNILADKPSDRVIDPSLFPRMEEILKLDPTNKLEVALKIIDMLDDIAFYSLTNNFMVMTFDLCLKMVLKDADEATLELFNKRLNESRAAKNR